MATADGSNGERIARRMARAGIASRRAAEAMIAEGRVSVNGEVIHSPALNVTERDRITVDGQPLAAPEPVRLWRYYKPVGLVTSERDEKGRETVFDRLPETMPRVVSIGRLDLNSEGLLLLTNDGDLKRRLELPATGWLRKYRVRAHGEADDSSLEPLRRGVEVAGERFQPMTVTLDRKQGSNVWLTVALREGRNREVRRALEAVGLRVNRLIRVSYGPFQLGELEPGEVEEVRPKAVREQLGIDTGRAAAASGGAAGRSGKTAAGKAAAGKTAAGKAAAGKAGAGGTAAGKAAAGRAAAGKPAAGKTAGKAGPTEKKSAAEHSHKPQEKRAPAGSRSAGRPASRAKPLTPAPRRPK